MRKEKPHISDIIRIVMRHIDKSINEEENNILQEWLNKSEENKNIFSQIISEEKQKAAIQKMSSYKKTDAWEKINRNAPKAKSLNISLFVRIAAAVVFILSASILVYKTNNFNSEELSDNEIITTGRSTARLITSSGKSFNLDTLKTVHLGGKSQIHNTGKQLIINSTQGLEEKENNNTRYNIIEVPIGGEYSMTLSDGTKIHLNSESSIKFPNTFSGETRDIFLKGEAYFDVKKDKKPFIIHMDDTYVKVLGTSFNINAYRDHGKIQTTLVSGSVAMGNNKIKKEIKLKPGYQGEYDLSTQSIGKREVDVNYYISWKNGIFAFKDKRFEDVMNILSRWYEFDVFYQNPSVKDIVFTGKMKRYSDIKEILHNFEMTEDLSFTIKGKSIIIRRNE